MSIAVIANPLAAASTAPCAFSESAASAKAAEWCGTPGSATAMPASIEGTRRETFPKSVEPRPGSLSGVLLEAVTGAARRADPDSSAFGRRDAAWNATALAIWEDPRFDEEEIGWARALTADLEASALSVGSYVNYISHDERPDRALAAFGADRLERLRAVKRRYDPGNVLRFNLNIEPGGGQAADVPSRP